MNIFYEYEDFIGRAETAHLNCTMQEFFELAVSICRKLGKQGYLLDKYLSCVLDAVNSIGIQDSADAGFDAASELRQLCGDVLDSKSNCGGHPLYEAVKTYIESYPVSFQEDESRLNYYCINLLDEFISYAAERFLLCKKDSIHKTIDIITLRDLYRKISAITSGEEHMERLNLLIRQRFLIATPMSAFLQGLTTDLLLSLTYRDSESSKQIFQLMLDEKTEGETL